MRLRFASFSSSAVVTLVALASGCPTGPAGQTETCRQYLECQRAVDAVAGSNAADTVEMLYGPEGTCWLNQWDSARCDLSCEQGLEAARSSSLGANLVECGGTPAPDAGTNGGDDGGAGGGDDAGNPVDDGGTAGADAGGPSEDGGAPGMDAGVGMDGGSDVDAGIGPQCSADFERVYTADLDHAMLTGARLVAVDVDGDGASELIYPAGASNTLVLLKSDGNGAISSTGYTVSGGPEAVAIGLLDEDGALDILSVDDASNQLSLLRGNGDGTFADAITAGAVSGDTSGLALASLNAATDDILDVATGLADVNGGVLYAWGNGDGTFYTANEFNLDAAGREVAAADLDLDQRDDLVFLRGDNTLSSALQLAEGGLTFGPETTLELTFAEHLLVEDLEGDGAPDAVVWGIDNDASVALVYSGTPEGEGPAGFGSSFTRSIAPSGPIADVGVGDIDGDLDQDLAVAIGGASPAVMIALTAGGSGPYLAWAREPVAVAIADVDGDGAADLITVTRATGESDALEIRFGCPD